MDPNTSKPIGLVAGAGDIPVYFARKAQEMGMTVVSVSFTDEIGKTLAPYVHKNFSISPVKGGKILKQFEAENIHDVIILGKVDKGMIFKPQMFDLVSLKFVMSLATRQDKTILTRLMEELEDRGFKVIDQKEIMEELFPKKGVLTRTQPSKKALEDIEFGFSIARYMADNEIGQTLVVKNKTVIAVEAVEGTDQTIERGCRLAQGECAVIKVSRTDQDYRYDSPGIGPKTLHGMIDGKASVLALEAGRVMVVEMEQVVKMADDAGLAIVCI